MSALCIRPTYSVAYSVRADGLPPSRRGNSVKVIRAEGIIKARAAAKLKVAINWMLLFSHKKRVYSKKEKKQFTFVLNFITLTLSSAQMHTDDYVKAHMLRPFLKWLDRNNAKMYVWRAEVQLNGNIHFHITTNTFIHWKSIRRKWNSIQSKHGYLKKWTEGNVEGDPSASHVKAVKNERETARYMGKYMTKPCRVKKIDGKDVSRLKSLQTADGHQYLNRCGTWRLFFGTWYFKPRPVEGRLWGSSNSLAGVKLYYTQHDADFYQIADWVAARGEYKKLDFADLWTHPSLKYLNPSGSLRGKLAELYKERKRVIPQQKFFTVESFY